MTSKELRTFESGAARRDRTIISIGFVGYSGAGKTYSMLRCAAGMQDALGGKTVLVDSNLKRSLYYAPKPGEQPVRGQTFDFEVVHFTPPFDPASCRAAFEHALRMGATRILWDCASDEWEGEGGVLDAHDRAIDEMIGRKRAKGGKDANAPEWQLRDKLSDTAWIKVKREHLALRLWMWQQRVDWLVSFRAKEKIDRKSSERTELGWQPIGGNDLVYDLMLRCLLPPSSDGTPLWNPTMDAEKLLVKPPPGPIRDLLRAHPQVNEELGYQLARWATGHDIEIRPTGGERTATSSRTTSAPGAAPAAAPPRPLPLADRFDSCRTRELFAELDREMRTTWERIPKAQRGAVREAFQRCERRIKAMPTLDQPPPAVDDEEAQILADEARLAREGGDDAS